uniref:ATP synthase subunit a n=1 Tax=Longicollum sp. (in: thorny-headed worms) TaxID=3073164 RepID=A0AA49K519_9BILA|nr:ATP synthase F0 subunit 6 [Longicollum sp. (in: thorny-headed worms)]
MGGLGLAMAWGLSGTLFAASLNIGLMKGLSSSFRYLSALGSSVAVSLVLLNLTGLLVSGAWTMGYGLVMAVSVTVWVWGVMSLIGGWGLSTYLSHFAIAGVGGVLGLILPLAEFVSVAVRPLTLGVRLATNISSGHVLMLMMGLALGAVKAGVWLLPLWVAVVVLEVFVCVLQGVIYSVLVVIYVD